MEQGGWISERGRLKDDPYLIVQVSHGSEVGPHPRPDGRSGSRSDWLHQREEVKEGAPAWRVARRRSRLDPSSQRGEQGTGSSRDGEALLSVVDREDSTREEGKQQGRHGRLLRDDGYPFPRHKETRASNRTALASACTDENSATPATEGSFGAGSGKSPGSMAADNVSGKRVSCPVCDRGMDHWKSARRQQVTDRDSFFQTSTFQPFLTLIFDEIRLWYIVDSWDLNHDCLPCLVRGGSWFHADNLLKA